MIPVPWKTVSLSELLSEELWISSIVMETRWIFYNVRNKVKSCLSLTPDARTLLTYHGSIKGGHTLGGASPRIPYSATSGVHASLVSCRLPISRISLLTTDKCKE